MNKYIDYPVLLCIGIDDYLNEPEDQKYKRRIINPTDWIFNGTKITNSRDLLFPPAGIDYQMTGLFLMTFNENKFWATSVNEMIEPGTIVIVRKGYLSL